MKDLFLKNTGRRSPLQEAQTMGSMISHKSGRRISDVAPALPLTSLIDAFSIIVIYLLMATQSGSGMDMNVPNKMQLPIAESGNTLEQSTIVRIEKGMYFIDDELVSAQDLGRRLYALKKTMKDDNTQILVQADQMMNYAALDPLLRAGSEAGIQKIKFAVLPKQ